MPTRPNCDCNDFLTMETMIQSVHDLMSSLKVEGFLNKINLNGKDFMAYFCKYCLLIAVSETEYELSFTVSDYELHNVAKITNVLTKLLQDKLHIVEDNFVDSETSDVFFGTDAYEAFEDAVNSDNGLVYCNICERYVPEDLFISELQYCKVCNEITVPVTTFH